MSRTIGLLAIFVSMLTCGLVFGQATKTTIPQANEDVYVTDDFGNCTFARGKDRNQYVQPYVSCISGVEKFILVPQEDNTWGLVVTPGDETARSKGEDRSSLLKVTIKVDTNAEHEFSMIWPKNMNMALDSVELTELAPLLDELRRGDSMTISRNGEVIEYDLHRANEAFTDLVFEQLVALTRGEKATSE